MLLYQVKRILLVFSFTSAVAANAQNVDQPKIEFDHIVLFVSDDALRDSLNQIFTPAENLTTVHENQGTTGYYYLFYNTFIELLYLTDSAKARINQNRFGSDYVARWSGKEDVSPIAFGMNMLPWDTAHAKANYHRYQSLDAAPEEYYLMSRYNGEQDSPLIYISMPNRAYQSLNSLEDIKSRPAEIREDMRKYLTHSVAATELSKVIYSTRESAQVPENLMLLRRTSMIKVESSETEQLILVFGEGQKGSKEFWVNPDTKLIVRY
ncbi:MAG: hypothetical protein AAGC47_09995 [Bacteroidota bacterium]